MTPDRVIMIVSLDHGSSWRYVGAPLRAADFSGVRGGYTKFSGATLIEQAGQVYLAAVLGDEKRRGEGTFIFGFDDFAKGILHRDSKGAPALLHQIPLQSPQPGPLGGGFAAYTDACPFGLLTGEQASGAGFQIFKTYQKPMAN
jgi:hypothetical protein